MIAGPGPVSTNPKINIESSPRRGISTFLPCIDSGEGGFRIRKKASKESKQVFSYDDEEEDHGQQVTCSVTHLCSSQPSLELTSR